MLIHSSAEPVGIPRNEPSASLGDFPEAAKKSPHRRLLVVDDERLVRWSIAETLSAIGYDVVEAADGDGAILALADPGGVVDVVLLDLYLPDSDDLRVLGAMRRLAPETPVILMTAHGSAELFDRALKLGAVRVVRKPFDISELAPLIEEVLATSNAN